MKPGVLVFGPAVVYGVLSYLNDLRHHLHRTPGQRHMDRLARHDRRTERRAA